MISGLRLLPISRPCRGGLARALSGAPSNQQPDEPVQRSEKDKMIAGVIEIQRDSAGHRSCLLLPLPPPSPLPLPLAQLQLRVPCKAVAQLDWVAALVGRVSRCGPSHNAATLLPHA